MVHLRLASGVDSSMSGFYAEDRNAVYQLEGTHGME